MKLSDDKARRLSQLVWRERAWRWLPVAAGVVALLGAFLFLTETQMGRVDRTLDVRVHDATVMDIKRTVGHGAAIVHVRLKDGREVDAVSLFPVPPVTGAQVVVNEEQHASGRLTYDIVRFAH